VCGLANVPSGFLVFLSTDFLPFRGSSAESSLSTSPGSATKGCSLVQFGFAAPNAAGPGRDSSNHAALDQSSDVLVCPSKVPNATSTFEVLTHLLDGPYPSLDGICQGIQTPDGVYTNAGLPSV